MSLFVDVEVEDKATPELKRKMEAARPQRLNSFIGPAVSKVVKRNFLARPHNKRGWQPVNFWAGAARSTNWQVVPEGVVISVNQIGVRQRYEGGPIRPTGGRKAITIPVAEEAYGKTAADFGDQLQLVIIKGRGAWLALKSYEQRPQDKQHGRNQTHGPGLSTVRERLKFLFMLSAGVNQDADRSVLPTDEEILDTAVEAATEAVK